MILERNDALFDAILNAHVSFMESKKAYIEMVNFDPVVQLKEYGTVHIGFGRQSGASMYIARTARSKDLVICRNAHDVKTMSDRIMIMNPSGDVPEIIDPVHLDTIREWDSVWIDDASYTNRFVLDGLYKKLAGHCKRFILVK